jgi:hypothetical protein
MAAAEEILAMAWDSVGSQGGLVAGWATAVAFRARRISEASVDQAGTEACATGPLVEVVEVPL